MVVRDPVLEVVEEVGVGALGQDRVLVVRLERLADRLGLVGEVEDHGVLLRRVGPVQARQRLHGVHAAELLVHVHGVEQRLVEARLELVGDDEEPVLRALERVLRLRLGDPVEVRLGVLDPAVADGAAEGDEGAVVVPLLLQVPLQRPVVAHRVEPRPGDDHGLGAAVDPVGHVLVEVLDHDPDLLPDRVVVQLDEGPEQAVRLVALVRGVVLGRLEELPVGLVRRVVLEHVEDEPLQATSTRSVPARASGDRFLNQRPRSPANPKRGAIRHIRSCSTVGTRRRVRRWPCPQPADSRMGARSCHEDDARRLRSHRRRSS